MGVEARFSIRGATPWHGLFSASCPSLAAAITYVVSVAESRCRVLLATTRSFFGENRVRADRAYPIWTFRNRNYVGCDGCLRKIPTTAGG